MRRRQLLLYKIISPLLVMALLAGCSSFLSWDNAVEESAEESGDENGAASEGSAEDVELIEPAGSEPGIAAAAFRNI